MLLLLFSSLPNIIITSVSVSVSGQRSASASASVSASASAVSGQWSVSVFSGQWSVVTIYYHYYYYFSTGKLSVEGFLSLMGNKMMEKDTKEEILKV